MKVMVYEVEGLGVYLRLRVYEVAGLGLRVYEVHGL